MMTLHDKISIRSLSSVLHDFSAQIDGSPKVSVADIIHALHQRGFGVVLLFFSLPMALPLPVPPVINVLLAFPLLFLTAQQAFGAKDLYLPKFIKNKEISSAEVIGLMVKIIPFLKRLESLTKPRLQWMTGALGQKFTGVLGMVMALSVSIPLPLTNTVPSFGIAVMALGVLMRDGVAVMVGAWIGAAWVGLLVGAFLLFGAEGLDVVKEAIKSML